MPTERVVEVYVCGRCRGPWRDEDENPCCGYPTQEMPMGRPPTRPATLAPSSLAAAMLTLAEAVDRWYGLPGDEAMAELLDGESEVVTALAAVRAHEDYKGVGP